MLNHVNRYILLMLLFLLTGCHEPDKENKERDHKILELSKTTIGSQEYQNVRKLAFDSLKTWCSMKLPGYRSIWSFNYLLDSVLCFNSSKDRMVTAILVQCDEPSCRTDDVKYFYGAKIKGRWYFFRGGGTMVILREHYQKDIHKPVSFEKLHELAMEEMLRGYIKKNATGEWEINDAFFTAHFEDNGWGDFNAQLPKDTLPNGKHFTNKRAYFENIYLRVARNIWPPKENK